MTAIDYRIARFEDFAARTKEEGWTPGPDFKWTEEVEKACGARAFKTYHEAFRAMSKVQTLTGDTWCVLECHGEKGKTAW